VTAAMRVDPNDPTKQAPDSRLSGACLVGSFGSTLIAAVTSASDSSGVIATLSGGPTTLPGASTSPRTFGGHALRSMIVTVSGGGLGTTFTTPLTRTTLLSLADTAICAETEAADTSTASRAMGTTVRSGLIAPPLRVWYGGG